MSKNIYFAKSMMKSGPKIRKLKDGNLAHGTPRTNQFTECHAARPIGVKRINIKQIKNHTRIFMMLWVEVKMHDGMQALCSGREFKISLRSRN